MESTAPLSTPEEELAYLREQVAQREAQLSALPKSYQFERAQIISEKIVEHQAAPETVLTP